MVIQHLLFLQYSKNVECIIDTDGFPVCKAIKQNILQRININHNMPLYEPYIPRAKSHFYTCTTTECVPYIIHSISQLSNPRSDLKNCFLETPNKYACETLKYLYYKNIDKLLFLVNNIPTKQFYLADCLLYSDGERICHRKNNIDDAHENLVYTGTIVKPNEDNILSQNELICEESDTQNVYCAYNQYVPYATGLKIKEQINLSNRILLKTGPNLVLLKHRCKNNVCGYYSEENQARRAMREAYEPPGGSVYRCYYAKKQQICKKLYGRYQQMYNERDWLST